MQIMCLTRNFEKKKKNIFWLFFGGYADHVFKPEIWDADHVFKPSLGQVFQKGFFLQRGSLFEHHADHTFKPRTSYV